LRSKLAIGRSVEDKKIFSLVWSIGAVAKILILICVLVKLLNLCDHLSDVVSSESRRWKISHESRDMTVDFMHSDGVLSLNLFPGFLIDAIAVNFFPAFAVADALVGAISVVTSSTGDAGHKDDISNRGDFGGRGDDGTLVNVDAASVAHFVANFARTGSELAELLSSIAGKSFARIDHGAAEAVAIKSIVAGAGVAFISIRAAGVRVAVVCAKLTLIDSSSRCSCCVEEILQSFNDMTELLLNAIR